MKKSKPIFKDLDKAAFESSIEKKDVQFGEPSTWKQNVPEFLEARNRRHEPSAQETWNVIYKSMTPKERRQFFKDKKEKPKGLYDDIPKVIMPESDFKISEKFSTSEEDQMLEKIRKMREPDPDIEGGLGSLLGVNKNDF